MSIQIIEPFTNAELGRVHQAEWTERCADAFAPLLERSGALLIRGASLDLAGFNRLVCAWTDEIVTVGLPKHRPSVTDDGRVSLAATGTDGLFLHRELGYIPFEPTLCFFCCERPSAIDGQTTLCDGVALLDVLPTRLVALFERRPLRYRLTWNRENWTGYLQVETADAAIAKLRSEPSISQIEYRTVDYTLLGERQNEPCLVFDYTVSAIRALPSGRLAFSNSLVSWTKMYAWTNLVRVSFDDGEPIPPGVIEEVHECAESHALLHAWARGEVLVLDNRRVMHGRKPFQGERTLYSAFGHRRRR